MQVIALQWCGTALGSFGVDVGDVFVPLGAPIASVFFGHPKGGFRRSTYGHYT